MTDLVLTIRTTYDLEITKYSIWLDNLTQTNIYPIDFKNLEAKCLLIKSSYIYERFSYKLGNM